ncbi:MAG TPA: hypothetical protein VJ714_12845 [Anaerolineae bacterium]|nr:hypothetical protein [Anaerolineae bacterium]
MTRFLQPLASDGSLHAPPILVHFRAREKRYSRVERWGKVADFDISRNSHPELPAAPLTE